MTRDKVELRPLRVLIVEDDSWVGMGLRAQLEKMGHQVLEQAGSTGEAIELFQTQRPDVVMLGVRLDGLDGIDLAQTLQVQRRCPIVLLSGHCDRDLVQRAVEAGVFAYLVKPVPEMELAAMLQIAVARYAETELLRAEKTKLAQDLETRKLVERAKGILMKRASLAEDEAHRRLQQESQKRRIPLPELCKRIIESDEVLGG